MPREISARRADYTLWQNASVDGTGVASSSLMVEPCESVEPLQELVGRLRKLKHDKNFLAKIFERRDRELLCL